MSLPFLLDFIKDGVRGNILLDLFQFTLDFGFYTQLPCHIVEKGGNLCEFVFGQQADLQIQLGALVRGGSHPVLRDEDEGGQEYCFH